LLYIDRIYTQRTSFFSVCVFSRCILVCFLSASYEKEIK
jgi:hypothetical protein